jgi:hypothetical protein
MLIDGNIKDLLPLKIHVMKYLDTFYNSMSSRIFDAINKSGYNLYY